MDLVVVPCECFTIDLPLQMAPKRLVSSQVVIVPSVSRVNVSRDEFLCCVIKLV